MPHAIPFAAPAAVALAALLAVGCTDAPAESNPPTAGDRGPDEAVREQLAAAHAVNDFGVRLYHELAKADDAGNLFFSPFSISSALAMTWEGARGETAAQMANVLALPGEGEQRWGNARFHAAMGSLTQRYNRDDLPYELRVANALWGERTMPFRDAYLDAVRPHYDAGFEAVNFREQPGDARERINDWVEQQTQDRIQDLMPAESITPDTRLVLTNAIYFLGAWHSPFHEANTKDRGFHDHGGDGRVPVPTMFQSRLDTRHMASDADSFEAVELAYEGGDLSMVILLPDEAAGLADLEARLTADALADWLGQLDRRQVNLYLPKFHVETEYTLNDTLAAMGMPLAFDERRADFTGLTDSAEGDALSIQHVVHKAFVNVDEEGTEAAAATGFAAGELSMPADPPVEVRVDRPFVYVIQDRATGAVLFMGRVVAVGEGDDK
ncbi:MAG: serpin family protein [Phycisphaeraceae bacterium]